MATLVDVSEGMRLANGTIVMPDGTIIDPNAPPDEAEDEELEDDDDALIEIPSNTEAQALVSATRRRLADLPAVPKTMNAISAVLSYSMFGLSDEEITLATGMTFDQLANIRKQEAYSKMHSAVVESILRTESDDIRSLIGQQSRKSVRTLVNALGGKKVSSTQVAVARDLLDRAGHRPVDVVEHRHTMENNLVIEIVRKDGSIDTPIIDMETE